jgi:tetratricopeptide (TPR) repeat protein
MAQVFLTRGDLDRALKLYEESLALKEQLGDKKGKGTSLSMLANLYMMKEDLANAEKVLRDSMQIAKELGYLSDIGFNTVKLGQVFAARQQKESALANYREGLAIFEKLGMSREHQQVLQMIANLESDSGPQSNDPLTQATTRARSAAEGGDFQSAIQLQQQAVELLRGAGDTREALATLSVLLFNLAGYYQGAERHEDAVKALEEVVAIDERTKHEDLESDRKALEFARELASLTPEEREQLRQEKQQQESAGGGQESFEAQLQAQLAQLPSEERARAEAQIRKTYAEFQAMTTEQQAAVMDSSRRAQIDHAADQARDAALAYARRQAPRKAILDYLADMAQKAAEGEDVGSPWLDVATLCLALVALIKQEPIPAVPVQYVAHFSAVQTEMTKMP